MNSASITQAIIDSGRKPKTAQDYVEYFKTIGNKLHIVNPTSEMLNQFDTIKALIEEYENISTRSSYSNGFLKIATVCKLSKDIIQKYTEFNQVNMKNRDNNKGFSKATPQQIKDFNDFRYEQIGIEREKLFLECKNLNKINFKHYQFILCSLYSRLPPLRIAEWCSTYVAFTKEEVENYLNNRKNFIDVCRKKLIVQNYKTDKYIGKRVINLDDIFLEELLYFQSLTKTKLLLPLKNDFSKPNSDKTLAYYFKSLFNKNIGCRMLRNLYCSQIIPTLDCDDREVVAHIMGHSVSTAHTIYSKFNTTLHPELLRTGDFSEEEEEINLGEETLEKDLGEENLEEEINLEEEKKLEEEINVEEEINLEEKSNKLIPFGDILIEEEILNHCNIEFKEGKFIIRKKV